MAINTLNEKDKDGFSVTVHTYEDAEKLLGRLVDDKFVDALDNAHLNFEMMTYEGDYFKHPRIKVFSRSNPQGADNEYFTIGVVDRSYVPMDGPSLAGLSASDYVEQFCENLEEAHVEENCNAGELLKRAEKIRTSYYAMTRHEENERNRETARANERRDRLAADLENRSYNLVLHTAQAYPLADKKDAVAGILLEKLSVNRGDDAARKVDEEFWADWGFSQYQDEEGNYHDEPPQDVLDAEDEAYARERANALKEYAGSVKAFVDSLPADKTFISATGAGPDHFAIHMLVDSSAVSTKNIPNGNGGEFPAVMAHFDGYSGDAIRLKSDLTGFSVETLDASWLKRMVSERSTGADLEDLGPLPENKNADKGKRAFAGLSAAAGEDISADRDLGDE